MRFRNTFFSKPSTPPRLRPSNESTNTDLSAGHTDAPSSPSVFADTPTPSASEPEISGTSDGGAGAPFVETAGTPASVKEEEESAPAWNEASRHAPGPLSASPTPAPRPPATPGVKPPSGRRPAPPSTPAGAESSAIWPWKRGALLESASASLSPSLPIVSVLSTESENSLEDCAGGELSSESGWPSTEYFFPLPVHPAQPVHPSKPHSAIEESGSASRVRGAGELQTARSPGLVLDVSNVVGDWRPGRCDGGGEEEDGDDEALLDERTTRNQLTPAVPCTPASVRESLAGREYQLRRYFVAAGQAAAAESARDARKAATDGKVREGLSERGRKQSRHPHEVTSHRRRWSNPFAAAASAIRVAPPHPPPFTGWRGSEVASGAAQASCAASTSALTGSGTGASTTRGSSSSTFKSNSSFGSTSPRCSLHPYLNADGTGTSSGPGGGNEAEVWNSEEQENANSSGGMQSTQLPSEVERSYKNGGEKKCQDNTIMKRKQHAPFGAPRETEEYSIGEREERITRDYAVDGGVQTRHSAGGSRTPLLDSQFFCKENGTEDIGRILRNDELRTAFKLFLENRWCAENLDFVEQVMSYQKALLEMGGNDVEVLIEGRRIEEVFVARGSPREVNIGQDMQQRCMRNRLRDVERGEAGMDTFNAVAFELISMMAHTTLRDFKLSAAYCAIDACLHGGPRDTRLSGATSSTTYDDDEFEEMANERPRYQAHMSEATQRVADWYGLDGDETTNGTRTWC